MFGKHLHYLGKKLVSKCSKWLLIAVIAYIIWIGFISEQLKSTGKRLYKQGEQFYKEIKETPSSVIPKDSNTVT